MSKEKYREQDYRLIGQATFDNTHSPCPDITHSVAYGQEFQIVERLDGSLEKLQSKNAWAMALIVGSNGQPLPNSRPKKVPLKFLAVKGSVETYTWYFGKYNRVQGKVYCRMCFQEKTLSNQFSKTNKLYCLHFCCQIKQVILNDTV